MARHLFGTGGSDSLVGDPSDVNFFHNVGIGIDTAVGGKLNDHFFMQVDRFADKVDGGAGEDTLDYSGSDRAVNVDLSTGSTTAVFNTGTSGLSIAQQVTSFAGMEDVVGSKFNDTITGSAGDNRLDGGAGDDIIHAGDGSDTLIGGLGTNTLDGGNGNDTADYSSSAYSVLASLATGQGGEVDTSSGSFVLKSQDSYTSIENVTGSAQADMLVGNAADNVINGGGGDDLIAGGGGSDTLHGGDGDDRVTASGDAGTTTHLFGDGGNDTLYASAGTDVVDGGDGSDFVDYSLEHFSGWSAGGSHWGNYNWNPGVTVDLTTEVGHGGWAEGDTYTNIENVRGSDYNDTITGDDKANILVGMGGNDTIHGGGDNDAILGGEGDDKLFGDAGNDTLSDFFGTNQFDGGDGVDTVDYSQTDDKVVVDLTGSLSIFGIHSGAIDSTGHQISFDSYTSIENVEGGQNSDMILADNNDNVLDGNGGNDIVFGFGGNDTIDGGTGDDLIEGGAGSDHLDGGEGVNTISYSLSTTGVVLNLANSTAAGGDAAGDTIGNFQNAIGSDHNDVLIGSSGSNVLFEEAGNNILVGGAGHDTFAFASNLTGNNLITDFHVGEDKLAIVGQIGAHDMSDLHFAQVNGGTLITLDNSSASIMLAGVNTLDLLQHASTEIVFSQTLDPLLHG